MWRYGPGRGRTASLKRARQPRRGQFEQLEARQLLATFVVTSTGDEPDLNPGDGVCLTVGGTCTLRAAIEEANALPGADEIHFSIGSGQRTITPGSPYDPITGVLEIDGTTQPGAGTVPRIVIDGSNAGAANGFLIAAGNSTIRFLSIIEFGGYGISVQTAGANVIAGNTIGNLGGVASGNGLGGILIDNVAGNLIGGATAADLNVISGNIGPGILIQGAQATGNAIQNNVIGTGISGTANLGNTGNGITIVGASDVRIGGSGSGQENLIRFNDGYGVLVESGNAVTILRNSITGNDGLGINLAPGANHDIPTPVLTRVSTRLGVTRIQGTLTGYEPSTAYRLEFFSNPTQGAVPQAGTFLGAVVATTDPSGNTVFDTNSATTVSAGQFVTATATRELDPRDTSELAASLPNVTTTDLVLTGSAVPEPVARGGYLDYTFVARNQGQLEAAATFTTNLPTSLNFIEASSTVGTVTRNGQLVTVNLGLFVPGAEATIRIRVVPTVAAQISTIGTVTAPEDNNAANNTATVISNVQVGVNLVVEATANPNPGIVNEPLVIDYLVTNTGQAAGTGVILAGTFPDAALAQFVSITTTAGTVVHDATAGTFTATIGNLAIGGSALVRIVVTPSTTATLQGTAAATAAQPEIDPSNNTDSVTIPVGLLPPAPPLLPAPQVIFLQRYGQHRQVSSVTVGFDQPLEASYATLRSNYSLSLAGGDGVFGTADDVPLPVPVATYNPTTNQVFLTTRHRTGSSAPMQIVVNGEEPLGVRNLDGVLLAGNGSTSGTDFVGMVPPSGQSSQPVTPLLRSWRRRGRA